MRSLNCTSDNITLETVKDMEANPKKYGYSFAVGIKRPHPSRPEYKVGTQYTCGNCNDPVVAVFEMDEEMTKAFLVPDCCEEEEDV